MGATLNRALNLNQHINNFIQKAQGTRAALYPVFNNNRSVPLSTKLSVFKIYIKPIFNYTAPAWMYLINHSNWRRLDAIQDISLRTMTGVHYQISNDILRTSTNNTNAIRRSSSKILAYLLLTSKFPHSLRIVPE